MRELVRSLSESELTERENATPALAKICELGHAQAKVVVKFVVEEGAVHELVKLLSRSNEKLVFSAAYILLLICQEGYDEDVKQFDGEALGYRRASHITQRRTSQSGGRLV